MTQPLIDPEALSILEALADSLEHIALRYEEFGREKRWARTEQSAMAAELEGVQRQFGPDGDWAGDELNHAIASATVFVVVQQQHIQALAALLRQQLVIFSLAPIARSVQELSGRVAWLLDPRVDTRTRAARGILGQIEDARQAKRTAYALHHANASRFGQQLHDLQKRSVPALFYPSELDEPKPGQLVIRGQQVPGLREGVLVNEQVQQNSWNAGGTYDYLSNATHPTLHTALEMFGPSSPDSDTTTALRLDNMTYPYRLARNSALSFTDSWSLLAAYSGLEYDLPRSLARALDDLPEPKDPVRKTSRAS